LEAALHTTDERNEPAYPLAEAARYLRLPTATLRAWLVGAGGRKALISPAGKRPPVLSFCNLVEAHVLRALRTQHGVPVRAVRKAIEYAERELGITQLLLREDLRSGAGRMFLDRYGELINLTQSGQLAMKEVLDAHLQRVVWDSTKLPVRLHPFVNASFAGDPRLVAIDPAIGFGRPVLTDAGVSTATIVSRLDADESASDIASDYGITEEAVKAAVLYERAA
jgi:uncharacterized protein (DUF433 family)